MSVKENNEKSNFSNFNNDGKTIEYVSVEVVELDFVQFKCISKHA